MKRFVVVASVGADEEDEVTEQVIRDVLYGAGGDFPFEFEITSVSEVSE